MRTTYQLALVGVLVATSGCSTLSFAPPMVDREHALSVTGGSCKPHPRSQSRIARVYDNEGNQTQQTVERFEPVKIARNTVDGARTLIDNYIYAYECAAAGAANGRQATEFPALIAAIGAPAVAVFGGNPDATRAAGVASGTLAATGGYYGAQQKANILLSGLDALSCIKTVAVGVDPLTVQVAAAVVAPQQTEEKLAELLNQAESDPSVQIPYQTQYFDLITSAIGNVHRVVGHRLNNDISYDAAGVIAQVEDLVEEEKAAETQAGNQTADAVGLLQGSTSSSLAKTETVKAALVKINTLPPKLEQCALRAKM